MSLNLKIIEGQAFIGESADSQPFNSVGGGLKHRRLAFNVFFLISSLSVFFTAACRHPVERTLFTRLGAAETGIDFANTIVEDDSLNVLNFEYIYNGCGLGVGDFNADGLPDLFFAGNQVSGKLYLNRGAFKFEETTRASGIETPYWSTGVAVADVNDDGLPDIYLSTAHPDRRRKNPNQLFVNQGVVDGVPRFKEVAAQVGLADSSYATQAAFLDYDLDGDLDVYLLCNALEEYNRNNVRPRITDGSAHSNDHLYRNEGLQADGLPHFTDVSKQAGILIEGWGLGVGVSDFNDDGWPDIYCANDFLSNDLMWINNRDGTFSNRIGEYLKHQSHNSMGMDIADINNDSRPEIVTLDMMPDDNRHQKSMFPAPNYNKYQLDLKLAYQPQFVRNMLQLNQGGGVFSEIGQMAGVYATDWSWSALLADLDNDGFRDLWITNGYKKDITDLDFISYQMDNAMFGTADARRARTAAQFDQMIGVKKSNFVFRNRGDLTFEDNTHLWGLKIPSYSNGAVYADFDGDGDLDLATNNIEDPAFIFRNNLVESKQPKANYLRVRLVGPRGNRTALGAKVEVWTNAGQMHCAENYFIRGYKSTVEPVLHFGLGAATKVDSIAVRWPGGRQSIFRQVDVNQVFVCHYDSAAKKRPPAVMPQSLLLAVDIGVAGRHEENAFVDFTIQPLLPHRFSAAGPPLAVADVNGDNLEDFFMGGASGFKGKLFLQTTPGHFTVRDFPKKDLLCEETAAVFFDADRDGDADLYVVGGGYEWPEEHPAYQDQLYLNKGQGAFGAAERALPRTAAAGACAAAADYDADGDLDLFVGGRVLPKQYPRPARSYLLRNDGGYFSDVTPEGLKTPGIINAAIWADFNADRRPDLAFAGEFMAPQIWYNQGKSVLQPADNPGLASAAGWWNCLAAADCDADGDLDLIGGNLGLNTRYQASLEQPVTLYARDFDENGTIDPFMSRYIGGKEYLTHPRDAVTGQVPALKRRFLKYADYGQKTVQDIFTAQELSTATVLKAVEMRSCYFENLGNNQFKIKPLHNLAQVAPVNAVLARDFDGDGFVDLLLVGNNYAAEVQTGRYDAFTGLLMRGDGNGAFAPMPLIESGFKADLDARSLIRVRSKNRDFFVVGNNDGAVQMFALNR